MKLQQKKNIKVTFRGVSKDNPLKLIVVVQTEEGVIGKIFKKFLITLKKWRRYEYGCSKYLA